MTDDTVVSLFPGNKKGPSDFSGGPSDRVEEWKAFIKSIEDIVHDEKGPTSAMCVFVYGNARNSISTRVHNVEATSMISALSIVKDQIIRHFARW